MKDSARQTCVSCLVVFYLASFSNMAQAHDFSRAQESGNGVRHDSSRDRNWRKKNELKRSGIKIASKEKKKSSSNKEQKTEMKKWFDAFFPRLYYAKKLSDIQTFYSRRFMLGADKVSPKEQQAQLKKLKQAYISDYKIDDLIMHPGGRSCDVKIIGRMTVFGRRAYGYAIYRMVKENNYWRVDSLASRGKQW